MASSPAPTRDDPVVASLSPAVGGPLGSRAGRHAWWTPVRVILALTALAFAAGMLQKSTCFADNWQDGEQRYVHMCYSDLPYLHTGRGLAERHWPYSGDPEVRASYEVMEYPVGIAYAAWAAAWISHAIPGESDQTGETKRYVAVTAVLLGAATLLAAWLLAGARPGRPWDAAAFAVAPVLILTGLVNWDLYAVVLVAAVLWAWARGRPLLTGVLIGLGTAVKLYPLFLLGPILVLCLRSWLARTKGSGWSSSEGRRVSVETTPVRTFALATGGAVVVWVLANAPAYLTGAEQWRVFWSFNSERGADLGSLWLVAQQAFAGDDQVIGVAVINQWSWIVFGAWCVGVLVIGLTARRTPTLAQLGFLVVAGFLLVNKVYSPQYVLWLLPLAVLAVPRWRELLIWQAGEVLYFAAVWWYLGGFLAPGGGGDAGLYWVAIVLRVAAQLFLVGVVIRDLWRPDSAETTTSLRRAPLRIALL